MGYALAFILDLGISVSLSFGPCKAFSDALLGHAALRPRWPYLRLTLSNIHAMLGCCCVPLSPRGADVEPTCLCTAFVVCHVCHAVVLCGFLVVSWLRAVVCQCMI